jgi:hypothetical protein
MDVAEVFQLAVALIVLPVVLGFYRHLRDKSGQPYWQIAVAAIYAAGVFTIIESFVLSDVLNTLQHLSYGVAGVAATLAAYGSRKQAIAQGRT